MVRVKLIEGREGFFIGMAVGAVLYLIKYYWLQDPQLYSAISLAAVSAPSIAEQLASTVLAPTFKMFVAYVGIGAVLGFIIDIVYTWFRRNF